MNAAARVADRLDRILLWGAALLARWIRSPVLVFDLIRHVLVGAAFWIMAKVQVEAFSAQTFGQFALLFPAEFRAGAMMAGGLLTFIGVVDPPKRAAIVTGSAISAAQFTGLAYSAIMTGGEAVVGLFASTFAAGAINTLVAGLAHDDT